MDDPTLLLVSNPLDNRAELTLEHQVVEDIFLVLRVAPPPAVGDTVRKCAPYSPPESQTPMIPRNPDGGRFSSK